MTARSGARLASTLRQLAPYAGIALGGILPLVILSAFAYLMAARAVENLTRGGNDAVAILTASMVEREAENWIASVALEAIVPSFLAAVVAKDADEVRRNLEGFVETYTRIDRAFVADPSGLLWSDYPYAPESVGRRFDDRDWFRGVAALERPYISEAYRRNAAPERLVVAVAAPVRHPDSGATIAYLVAQVRLDELSRQFRAVEIGDGGYALLIGHRGRLVAHPVLDVSSEIYTDYAPVRAGFNAEPGARLARGEYRDPFTGVPVIGSAATAAVGPHQWIVIAQQPRTSALAVSRTLGTQMAVASLMLAALMSVLFFGLARENSRRRQAEQALAETNQALERRVEERTRELHQKEQELMHSQKLEAVGRLAGGIAHDFNNLLTVILGSTELMMDQFPTGTPEREELREIYDAARRAANLTSQLLAFGRKQITRPTIIDLNEVLQEIRGMLDRVCREDSELNWQLSPGLYPVRFDRGQIEQVVMNLVVNARDAMPRGGRMTIATSNIDLDEAYVAEHPEASPGAHAVLAISDTGTGMTADVISRIFEPFFTTKRAGQGSGLGLSTAYGIVSQGGGYIDVVSEPGRGTTFNVLLPRAAGTVVDAPDRDTIPPAAPSGGTVLVVEDEAGVRSLIVRVLRGAGFDVVEAGSVAEAIEVHCAHTGRIDLLLSDVVLPDRNGPELAAELRRMQPRLRILFMSGYAEGASWHGEIVAEGADFISKPLRPRDLVEKVRAKLAPV